MSTLEIRDLHVAREGKEILKGVNLTVRGGEVHALMGPNGAGKSTLAATLAGHPGYQVTAGQVYLDGEDLLVMSPDERARRGLFLAMQYPTEVPGVRVAGFLRTALSAREGREIPVLEFRKLVADKLRALDMDESFLQRYVNDGFSGGEKKRHEMLQMMLLHPAIALLDETDSGLDIDALRVVTGVIRDLRGPDLGLLIITHYQRVLERLDPNYIHVMVDGRIVISGDHSLAAVLEEKGYGWVEEQYGPAAQAPASATTQGAGSHGA